MIGHGGLLRAFSGVLGMSVAFRAAQLSSGRIVPTVTIGRITPSG